jgi:hypothetical protein
MTMTVSIIDFLYAARYLLGLLFGTILWKQWSSYRRLSQFKGPFWASITNLWMADMVSRKRQHMDLFEVHQRYGPSPLSCLVVLG